MWRARVCLTEYTRTYCALSVFPSGRASFDFTGGTCRDRSQMIQDDSKPSWLSPLERPAELWERGPSSQSPPSAVLEEPLQRAGRGPVQSPAPCPSRPSRPGASSEVVRPTPPWHGARRTTGIAAENSPPIHHGSLPAAFVLHRHFP